MRRGQSLLLVLLAVSTELAACRFLRFASPLQSLTIPDPGVKDSLQSKRQSFLPKFKAGLEAEVATRRALAAKRTRELQASASSGDDWAEQAANSESERRKREDRIVERAFDRATSNVVAESKLPKSSDKNKYQFVGVINRTEPNKPITWYAREKPATAKWSVRLVHVNRDAIVKDLFNRGKVDIFAKYQNTGKVDEETKAPIVMSKYEVRERSLKNLWNFNPKHFFTDSSGMYWRERRLRPGMYTDGLTVYEASYRYRDGRNGMHRVSSFPQFLSSKSVSKSQKESIVRRLQKDSPDVVLEDY